MDVLTLDFRSPCGLFKLTFEDDGKVAYAYLKKDKQIVGDVWLYNRCPAPPRTEWSDRKNIPFANCQGYLTEKGTVSKPVGQEDVILEWKTDEEGPVAYIYIFEELYGVVGVGDKPGYARFAGKSGPLAKVMQIEGGRE